MRTTVLVGLFACVAIFGLSSSKAGATSIEVEEILQSQKPETSAVELLVAASDMPDVVTEKKAEEKKEPVKHTIAENESLSDVAKEYDTTWKRIYDKNTDIENPDVVSQGTVVVIPEADEKLEARELPTPEPAPAVASTANSGSVQSSYVAPRGSSAGNGYVPGNCTWYAKSMRPDLPNNLGNAYTWVSRAAAQGIATGSTPRVGAVAQRNNHVAYVQSVNGDGTITISDMNYRALYAVTTRTVPANQWSYIY